ncbi:MAG: alpha/beta hydrolase [Solirubrobacterales bacterium]|nr:alpha/beta hydrolase [Solirubrobacterales bacterium]
MQRTSPELARLRFALERGLVALPQRLVRLLLGPPLVVDGQRLHLEAQLALITAALTRAPALQTMSVAEARAWFAEDARAAAGRKLGGVRTDELAVEGATGPLPARLYTPDRPGRSRADGDQQGLLVYFHGGGFVVCDLDTHDNPCRFLARQADVQVLSVGYRLAPEQPFPAAIDDAVAAFRFAVERARDLGADPARVAVGGDSAGANLATGVCRLARGDGGSAPAFQVLLYPWLDLSSKRASYELFGNGPSLSEAEVDWFKDHYLSHADDALDPRCSPLLAEDLAGVAPAFLATAGFDPLRDEGEEYAARLSAAGVAVALRRHSDLTHGFLKTISIGHASREALLEAVGALRLALVQR